MTSSDRPAPTRALAAMAAALVLAAGGCFKTDTLARAFNAGALDNSSGDPFHDPTVLKREIARHLVKEQLTDGYFGQGPSPDGAYVAKWLDRAAQEPQKLARAVVDICCAQHANIGESCHPRRDDGADPDPNHEAELTQAARANLLRTTKHWANGDVPETALCNAGALDAPAARRFVDYVRFHAAVERAVRAAAPVLVERLVSPAALQQGAAEALSQAAAYLRARRWRREMGRRTTGLVVKGGASTGIYSAGIVWVALHLIDSCLRDDVCSDHGKRDLRFSLISGTSTGAMISAAVDHFNAAKSEGDRGRRIDRLARWFTCYGVSDLYCVRQRPIYDLADAQTGVMEFQGIDKLLRAAVDCDMLNNESELLLNTVDFRSGRIWALSDQDPAENRRTDDVVRAAVASAALPLIVKPIGKMPVNYDKQQEGTWLDGGIRSEIPLLPLAQRGAERVLLVASAQSVLGETKPLTNALSIAQRYIDVSTGGVAERDLAFAQQYIESARLAEIDACLELLRQQPALCPEPGCHAEALCEASWNDVCAPATTPATTPTAAPVAGTRTYDRIRNMWKLTSFFRDETAVEGLHGYSFEPSELRRLFYAGAEAGRVRCQEIARTLGLPVDLRGMPAKIARWCIPDLPDSQALCDPSITGPHVAAGEVPVCDDDVPFVPGGEGKDCGGSR
jgi:predicted acylesterase/phospholipase RssA